MTSVNQNVDEFSNQFYNVTCKIIKFHEKWKGEVAVTRKDTNEEVPVGAISIGKDKEYVKRELYSAIKKKTSFLANPPPDWNSTVRKVLVQLYKSSQSIIFFASNLDKKNKKHTDEIDDFFLFCNQIEKNTIDLVKKINGLTREERLDLLTISDEYLQGVDNPFTIENESSLRIAVFDYFINPTDEEFEAYKENRCKVEGQPGHP